MIMEGDPPTCIARISAGPDDSSSAKLSTQ